GDGLRGNALVVLSALGLLRVGDAGFIESFGAPFLFGITIGRAFVRFCGGGIVRNRDEQNFLLLVRAGDVHLRLGRHVAIRAILDNLVVKLDRFLHGGEEGDHIPKLVPFAREETVGNDELPLYYFVI